MLIYKKVLRVRKRRIARAAKASWFLVLGWVLLSCLKGTPVPVRMPPGQHREYPQDKGTLPPEAIQGIHQVMTWNQGMDLGPETMENPWKAHRTWDQKLSMGYPFPCGQTHTCENITFPHPSDRGAKNPLVLMSMHWRIKDSK